MLVRVLLALALLGVNVFAVSQDEITREVNELYDMVMADDKTEAEMKDAEMDDPFDTLAMIEDFEEELRDEPQLQADENEKIFCKNKYNSVHCGKVLRGGYCKYQKYSVGCQRSCKSCAQYKASCVDKRTASYCKKVRNGGFCKTESYRKSCPGSCKECLKCKNLDSDEKCNKAMRAGDCKYKATRDVCNQSCMVCCADLSSSSWCKSRKKLCRHKRFSSTMRNYCPKTCGHCGRASAAMPKCVRSKYGCCWDRSTTAAAPIGSGKENCPACKDRKINRFCNQFTEACTNYNPDLKKGAQIRFFCPKTCRLCGEKPRCMDDSYMHFFCQQYKYDGTCKKNPSTMKYYCNRTCGFCKPCNDHPDVAARCPFLKKHRACKQNADKMKKLCSLTCGFC
eukprot:Seg1540.1 transcript_id=Seg1540.1/GoldUCD/mRNA.D3Y31 product="hypothetical protein" protein_id=Seg1540.1/GoldUCD/D3Y31